jgi:broad specificity phosphatase PhoE
MTNTKNIYFVRHGQSQDNASNIYPEDTTQSALTELGKEQAALTGDKLSHIDFDTIISSTYLRAIQTAQIINSKQFNPKELQTSRLLIEKLNPSIVTGQVKGLEPMVEYYDHFHDLSYRMAGSKTLWILN